MAYYSIGEMAKILGVATSTLRYYDKEGLLPFVERTEGGVRRFKDEDVEWLVTIEHLKKTGMPIRDIAVFVNLDTQGDETIAQRLELIDRQRDNVRQQIAQLENTLKVLDYKHWYYETALEAGTCDIHKIAGCVVSLPSEHREGRDMVCVESACNVLKKVREEKLALRAADN